MLALCVTSFVQIEHCVKYGNLRKLYGTKQELKEINQKQIRFKQLRQLFKNISEKQKLEDHKRILEESKIDPTKWGGIVKIAKLWSVSGTEAKRILKNLKVDTHGRKFTLVTQVGII